MTTTAIATGATTRHDRAALGVIATYLHELTAHGQPRERDEDAERDARFTTEDALAGRAASSDR
ncbi:hypothetical protein [Conexibacter woesei]|uniref:Uncharacterized protein n=1 Tax=Conexibacter woesei (strain DSM 14684 / CCUG 47730 / CIP 108061 / JCM 11494 / NBRC 100937 / ID131577) TaxID=469383 RepID=D3F3G4_CONWI|nr:hypothetical protein [Conexibacter woesei]ADB52329.1 hypothetical protein Cwoe_3912 [Conexibacter woesei DSM 14684]